MKNRNNLLTTILLALGCLALSPLAQRVVPAPDGGYPGVNTAEGQNALFSLTTGGYNTAVGFFSLRSDTNGSYNTAIGAGALLANIGDANGGVGHENTATGVAALLSNTTGPGNTATGAFALYSNTTGNDNTALGVLAGSGVITANNVICIGSGVTGANVSNSCCIGNIFAQPIDPVAAAVVVDFNGKLGTVISSRRFKHDIKPMDKASEALLALKPVTFHYKSDTKDTPQFGLIAEEVAEVNSDLIVREKNGEILSVRYDQVNAMLLNEFLKEHRKVQHLQKGMAVLTTQLKEQAAQIQKVSTQLEVAKPAPQTVLNSQ